jgi:hypothetical protein
MTTPDAVLGELAALAERYLDVERLCLLCKNAPACMSLVFVDSTRTNGYAHGCIFATCVFCRLSESFEERVNVALSKERGRWN